MENIKDTKDIRVYLGDNAESGDLKEYLAENFKLVGSSSDGEEVLTSVLSTGIDVLVLEAMLSKIDGFMVLEKIKAKFKENMPKVIFVSTLSHSGFISKAMNEGASYFMVKPVSKETLKERIINVMSMQKVETQKTGKHLEEKISNIFITIGIPAHIKGYQFLREAVKLAIEEPEIIGSITKKLYPTIADKFETSSSKVERGMRHAIEVAWNRGKIENINSLFGLKIYTSNEKPTNGELIALIADKMLMEM